MGQSEQGMPQRTFTSVLEGVDIPSWIVDHSGRIIWSNDAWVGQFGDHRGDYMWSTVSPNCAADVKRRLTRLWSGRNNVGISIHFEVVAIAADGRSIRSEVSAVRLQPGRFRGAVFGVTILKRAQSLGTARTHLTRRQLEVLQLLAAGRSTDQIAAELVLSPTTIRNHVNSILQALGAHSRLEAVINAQRQGLVGS